MGHSDDRLQVGDRVRFEKWEAIVDEVYGSGKVCLDFTVKGNPLPLPFFTAPYHPSELERVHARPSGYD